MSKQDQHDDLIDLRTGIGIDAGLHDALLFHARRFIVCESMGLVAAFGQC